VPAAAVRAFLQSQGVAVSAGHETSHETSRETSRGATAQSILRVICVRR